MIRLFLASVVAVAITTTMRKTITTTTLSPVLLVVTMSVIFLFCFILDEVIPIEWATTPRRSSYDFPQANAFYLSPTVRRCDQKFTVIQNNQREKNVDDGRSMMRRSSPPLPQLQRRGLNRQILPNSRNNNEYDEDAAKISMDDLRSNSWIVLVDDEESIRTAVSQLFRTNGYQRVTTCQNGQEAWESLMSSSSSSSPQDSASLPHCIICDVRMPVMDGLELLQQIRQHPQFQTIPVILLTAKGMTQDRIQGYDCGADAYLSKPFQPTELVAIVERYLIQQQQQQQQRKAKSQQQQLLTSAVNVQDLQQQLNEIKDLLMNKGGGGIGNGWVDVAKDGSVVVFSKEEQGILDLLARGMITKEIASTTHLSTRRIEQLLTGMFRKTGTKNRTELVKWAVSKGHVE
jgi:DNA-binding NarL/FixJ family response regulator